MPSLFASQIPIPRAAISPMVMASINSQIPVQKGKSFIVDENVAKIAQNQFNKNFTRNRICSKLASLVGVVGVLGLSTACIVGVGALVSAIAALPWIAVGLAVASFALIALWIFTRNQEGFLLSDALLAKDEETIIRKLALGADLAAQVPIGFPGIIGLIPFHINIKPSPPITVIQHFVERGSTKVVTYLLLREGNMETRSLVATQALPYVQDNKMAQLLLDFGAKPAKCPELLSKIEDYDLDTFRLLYCGTGIDFTNGKKNYVKWQEKYDALLRSPPPREVYNFCLLPSDWEDYCEYKNQTVIERLVTPCRYSTNGISEYKCWAYINPALAFETLGLDASVYQGKASGEELFHSLNQAGIRIHRKQALELHERLNPQKQN